MCMNEERQQNHKIDTHAALANLLLFRLNYFPKKKDDNANQETLQICKWKLVLI